MIHGADENSTRSPEAVVSADTAEAPLGTTGTSRSSVAQGMKVAIKTPTESSFLLPAAQDLHHVAAHLLPPLRNEKDESLRRTARIKAGLLNVDEDQMTRHKSEQGESNPSASVSMCYSSLGTSPAVSTLRTAQRKVGGDTSDNGIPHPSDVSKPPRISFRSNSTEKDGKPRHSGSIAAAELRFDKNGDRVATNQRQVMGSIRSKDAENQEEELQEKGNAEYRGKMYDILQASSSSSSSSGRLSSAGISSSASAMYSQQQWWEKPKASKKHSTRSHFSFSYNTGAIRLEGVRPRFRPLLHSGETSNISRLPYSKKRELRVDREQFDWNPNDRSIHSRRAKQQAARASGSTTDRSTRDRKTKNRKISGNDGGGRKEKEELMADNKQRGGSGTRCLYAEREMGKRRTRDRHSSRKRSRQKRRPIGGTQRVESHYKEAFISEEQDSFDIRTSLDASHRHSRQNYLSDSASTSFHAYSSSPAIVATSVLRSAHKEGWRQGDREEGENNLRSFCSCLLESIRAGLPYQFANTVYIANGFLQVLILSQLDHEDEGSRNESVFAASALITAAEMATTGVIASYLSSTSAVTARRTEDESTLGIVFQQAVMWAMVCAIPVCMLLSLSEYIFLGLGQSAFNSSIAAQYLQVGVCFWFRLNLPPIPNEPVSILSVPTRLLLVVCDQFVVGAGRPMVATLAMLVFIVLSTCFSFVLGLGKFGFEEWGVKGVAGGVCISALTVCIAFLGFFLLSAQFRRYNIFNVFFGSKRLCHYERTLTTGGRTRGNLRASSVHSPQAYLYLEREGEGGEEHDRGGEEIETETDNKIVMTNRSEMRNEAESGAENLLVNCRFVKGGKGSVVKNQRGKGSRRLVEEGVWSAIASDFCFNDRLMVSRLLFAIGFPLGFKLLSEQIYTFVQTMMAGWIGTAGLMESQIAMQYMALTIGAMSAQYTMSCVLVALDVVERAAANVRKLSVASHLISASVALTACALFVTIPRHLSDLFIDPTEELEAIEGMPPESLGNDTDPYYEVMDSSRLLLGVIGFLVISDSVMGISGSCLRSFYDVTIPVTVAIVLLWVIGMPLSYSLAFHTPMGVSGLFMGRAVAIFVVALIVTNRWVQKSKDPLGAVEYYSKQSNWARIILKCVCCNPTASKNDVEFVREYMQHGSVLWSEV